MPIKVKALLLLMLAPMLAFAQNSFNVSLLYQWGDTSIPKEQTYGIRFNEVWGVAINGREYGIIGSTQGTYIFDVTDTDSIQRLFFVPGAFNDVIHRDYHDYHGYLYMVSDEGNSTLQIADLHYLPDSLPIVYDSDALFSKTHNIFIDSARGMLYTTNGGVYSLADPESPVQVASNPIFGHDLYVRNDTAFWNLGNDGLYIYDYSQDYANPDFIGALTAYPHLGYNHSGWMNEAGTIYAFADETYGTDIKICDITDYTDVQVIAQVNSGGDTAAMPHNVLIHEDYLYISYYHDGLYIFDISNPTIPQLKGYYDTYPLVPPIYNGAWGVYPFLPSGKILVSDTEFGFFVLEIPDTVSTDITEVTRLESGVNVFPNPFNHELQLAFSLEASADVTIELYDISGALIKQLAYLPHEPVGDKHLTTSLAGMQLSPGIYFLKASVGQQSFTHRLVKMD